jgi:threonine dehydrogenase-like Zn-dependent dehydrogenase
VWPKAVSRANRPFTSRNRIYAPHTLAREFGATDIVSERGEEAVERVRELTDGYGVHSVLECVGLEQSKLTAIEIARPGGAVGRVGASFYLYTVPEEIDRLVEGLHKVNKTLGNGASPRRGPSEGGARG